MKINIGIVCSFFFFACTFPEMEIMHVGKKDIRYEELEIDSVMFDASQTSGRGNFYMQDSCIVFADSYYATIFRFKCSDGSFIDKHFAAGKGRDLMNGFMFVYPFNEKEQECIVIDNSLFVHFFDCREWKLIAKNIINFKWKNSTSQDYGAVSNYNLMSMTEFNCLFTKINDSLCYFPVNVMTRVTSPDGILDSDHYKKAHIFGLLNTHTMEVIKVFGKMPLVYQQRSVPHISFFDYTTHRDTIYVNFPIDSLVYVYKYPDTLLYTLGYECRDINREYTETYDVSSKNDLLRKDAEKVGIVNNIKYIPETGVLFRTYIKNMYEKQYGLQIYRRNNLIGDIKVPSYFKIVGYVDSWYYAVKDKPIETEEQTFFVFYRFRLK